MLEICVNKSRPFGIRQGNSYIAFGESSTNALHRINLISGFYAVSGLKLKPYPLKQGWPYPC
jgi:hypothetical protein